MAEREMSEISDSAIHKGHRARMRSKLRLHGPRIFDTYELLEMLLYYAIPCRDTNPPAKRLLARFGSLDGVLSASRSELLSVDGIGERAADLIGAVNGAEAVAGREKDDVPCFDSRETVAEFLINYFRRRRDVSIVVLLLDNSMRLLRAVPISDKGFSSGAVLPRDFVSSCLDAGASSAVVGYTYRDIVAFPHDGDMVTGAAVREALDAVGVPLLELLVAGDGDCYALFAGIRYKPAPSSFSPEGCERGTDVGGSRRISDVECLSEFPTLSERAPWMRRGCLSINTVGWGCLPRWKQTSLSTIAGSASLRLFL